MKKLIYWISILLTALSLVAAVRDENIIGSIYLVSAVVCFVGYGIIDAIEGIK